MKGFPKHLNTRYDVEYCLQNFPEDTRVFLAQKLAEVKQWLVTGKLAEGDAGIADETHKVVEVKDQATQEVKERYQYEYKDDPNCELFRLEYTREEVEGILATNGEGN